MKWTSLLPALLALPSLAFQPLLQSRAPPSKPDQCKCHPGDACWPTPSQWSSLNQTVSGRLVLAIPPGAACYLSFNGLPTFDAAKCAETAANWFNPNWMADQATLPMTPVWSNNTCEPNTATGSGPPAGCPATCLEGFLSAYAILATKASDIVAGVNFARKYNLRIIIRNTGHCFMGRSVGWGALVINTHRMKGIKFDGKKPSDGHTGGTVTIGAGVQFSDVYPEAWSQGLDILGGECPVSIPTTYLTF